MCLEENIVLFLEMCKRSQIDEKRNYMRSKTSQVLVILFIYFFYLSFQLGQSCCLISDVMEEFYCSWKMGILWQSQSLISEVLYPLPSPLNIFFFFLLVVMMGAGVKLEREMKFYNKYWMCKNHQNVRNILNWCFSSWNSNRNLTFKNWHPSLWFVTVVILRMLWIRDIKTRQVQKNLNVWELL